jgi:hypothetical protein
MARSSACGPALAMLKLHHQLESCDRSVESYCEAYRDDVRSMRWPGGASDSSPGTHRPFATSNRIAAVSTGRLLATMCVVSISL